MKIASSIFIGAVISLWCLNTSSSASAQQPVSQDSHVTLYSTIKHRGEQRKSCINFKVALTGLLRVPCDLQYGSLYAGDELDWFQSSTTEGARSVMKDLGDFDWSADFSVPVVEPLAKLKPGERRQGTIDTSGADGAPGKPGGTQIVVGGNERTTSSLLPINDGPVPGDITPTVLTPQPPTKPSRPKQDGKPKVDPLFVKAIAGHVYVIHVVDDSRDFYALFRVDALERGDYCTISWKLISDPQKPAGPTASR
jgi:hypothetical protein